MSDTDNPSAVTSYALELTQIASCVKEALDKEGSKDREPCHSFDILCATVGKGA